MGLGLQWMCIEGNSFYRRRNMQNVCVYCGEVIPANEHINHTGNKVMDDQCFFEYRHDSDDDRFNRILSVERRKCIADKALG
jgi:hypothetical protein